MDISLFSLLQFVALGIWVARRRRPVSGRHVAGVLAWLFFWHLAAGVWYAATGVEAPRTRFSEGRNV